MRKRVADSGFTLIEVMIALLVISITLTAVLKAINAQVFVTERIREADAARWVGLNIIAKMQSGILPFNAGVQEGEEVMLGKTWYWKSKPRETENRQMFQVSIAVGLNREDLDRSTVLGFVRSE